MFVFVCASIVGMNADWTDGVVVAGSPIELPRHSTFDGSLEGWTLAPGTGTFNWEFAGGNPRGFARFVDGTSGSGFIIAPTTFHGDWSALEGDGVLRWSHRVLSIPSGGTIAVPLEAVISGPGGSARFVSATPASSGQWVTISAPIQESSWSIETGTWDGLIQEVTSLQIRIEVVSGGTPTSNDIEAIDNVILYSAPSALTLPRTEPFDVALNGWTATSGSGTLTFMGSGGNPGGFAQFTDSGNASGFLIAPATWRGNWSTLNGIGLLSWDHRVIVLDPEGEFVPFEAIISGPGGVATFTSNQVPSTTEWVALVSPLRETDWVVETGAWTALLQNVTSLQIRAEVVTTSDSDIEGVDNIVLQVNPNVPAASTWGVILIGLLIMIAGFLVMHRRGMTTNSCPKLCLTRPSGELTGDR